MKQLLFAIIILPGILLAQEPMAEVTGGKIQGTQTEDGIQVFKGIPFAAPPVGELRWRAPQPVEGWEGVRACTDFGPSPMQGPPRAFMYWSEEFLIPSEPISEDCLYLNVWSGANESDEKRPVLVYIYGGGFRSGGTGCPIYDGEAMAQKGVVFVSLNYRVGVFGFLAHPELSEEADYGTSGNYALLDMVAGLKWVQENIAAFGGDPDNVTIAGQSAGAFAVSYLTATPLAKGLFHRAIAQSGGSFVNASLRPGTSLEEAEQRGEEFAIKSLGCESLEALRAKPALEILQAQGAPASPLIDGYVLPHSNAQIYQNGDQSDVPLLIGWNADDNVMFGTQSVEEFRGSMEEQFGEKADQMLQYYPLDTEEQALNSQYAFGRDAAFGVQVYAWAHTQDQHSEAPVFVYNFNRRLPAHSPETDFGAFHSGEIVYAYDNLHTLDRPWEPIDHEIADMMSDYWVNFATSGDPNGGELPEWKPFRKRGEQVLVIDTETRTQRLPTAVQLRILMEHLGQ